MNRIVATGLVLLLAAPAARAASVTLAATADNTIYAEDGNLSNGAGESLFAGVNSLSSTRRTLIRFDLTGTIPAAATVDSVVLLLHLAQATPGSQPVSLHRALASWGEGTADAPGSEGSGTTATPGDATWTDRFYQTQVWTSVGGDFDTTASATRPVGAVGFYSWRSAGAAADVAFWLANASANFGWMLVGNESTGGTARRFDSRQNATAGNHPALTIYYTENPTAVGDGSARTTSLLPAVPNPFNPTTTIACELATGARVRVSIYHVSGRLVRVLQDGMVPAGRQEMVWNGDDRQGQRVASGVYLVRLIADGHAFPAQKIVLLK